MTERYMSMGKDNKTLSSTGSLLMDMSSKVTLDWLNICFL